MFSSSSDCVRTCPDEFGRVLVALCLQHLDLEPLVVSTENCSGMEGRVLEQSLCSD